MKKTMSKMKTQIEYLITRKSSIMSTDLHSLTLQRLGHSLYGPSID